MIFTLRLFYLVVYHTQARVLCLSSECENIIQPTISEAIDHVVISTWDALILTCNHRNRIYWVPPNNKVRLKISGWVWGAISFLKRQKLCLFS
jgi:hypothetical protein